MRLIAAMVIILFAIVFLIVAAIAELILIIKNAIYRRHYDRFTNK